MKPLEISNKKNTQRDFERAPRQPMRQPRAVGRGEARHRRHDHDADQRDKADRERRQQRAVVRRPASM